MVHQCAQVGAEPDLKSNFSLLDEPHLFIGIEEDSLLAPNAVPSTGCDRSGEIHDPVDFAHLSIPRKPVGCNTNVESRTLLASIPVGEEHHVVQTAERSIRRRHIWKNWWMEIGACVLGLVTLVAVIGTLQPHQGKPLPQWPYHISVNALISIYVLVLKAAILLVTTEGLGQLKWRRLQRDRPLDEFVKYDQATRGPLGALRLLWQLRLRHPLSSAGALIALVVLAIDPFAQQIIRYSDCSMPIADLQATIPRTNVYLPRVTKESNMTEGGAPGLRDAINAGMTTANEIVSPVCLTGNCTFLKEYSTVAYCSSCTDVTEDLIVQSRVVKSNFTNVLEFSVNSTGNRTRTTQNLTGPSYLGNTNILMNTSLPSGLSVSTYPGATFNFSTMAVNTQEHEVGNSYKVEIIVGKQVNLFDPVNGEPPTGCNTSATNDTWYCKGYGAASCSLAPCVRTYTSTVEDGQLYETSTSTSNNTLSSWGYMITAPGDSFWAPYASMVDTTCLSDYERLSLVKDGYYLDPSTRWLAYNLTFDLDPSDCRNNPSLQCWRAPGDTSFPQSMLVNECLYVFDNLFVGDLWADYLDDFFNGTIEGEPIGFGAIDVIKGPQSLQTIYNYGNVTFDRVNEIFQNISNSMTSFIRQSNNLNWSNPAEGVTMRDQVCLSVRWPWLALPAVLVLLTVIFFVAMIVDTRPTEDRAPIWKSSPLALLFHGFELPNKQAADIHERDDMEELAKGITVRFSSTDGGLKLVESKNGEHAKTK